MIATSAVIGLNDPGIANVLANNCKRLFEAELSTLYYLRGSGAPRNERHHVLNNMGDIRRAVVEFKKHSGLLSINKLNASQQLNRVRRRMEGS